MPTRLSELKKISQGEREKAVIDAVTNLGFATIAEVTTSVAAQFELILDENNVFEAFKKSIRTDLKKLAGRTLGIAYFTKNQDSPLRVPEDDLEHDIKGKIKNIYNIKYFKLGSNAAVPGGDLILSQGGLFIPQYNQAGDLTVDWEIDSFKSLKKDHLHIVFKLSGNEFICVSAPIVDLPFKVVVGRGVLSGSFIPDSDNINDSLGNRSAVILLKEAGISRPKKHSHLGHLLMEFPKDGRLAKITDLDSTNGTFVSPIDEQYISKQLALSSHTGTNLVSQKSVSNLDIFKKIKSLSEMSQKPTDDPTQISLSKIKHVDELVSSMEMPFLLKVGEIEILVFTK